jgi:hypothetical protein
VDPVESLDINVIATRHGPAIRGAMVDEAFEQICQIPGLPRWTEPGQADLDALLAAEPATAGSTDSGA